MLKYGTCMSTGVFCCCCCFSFVLELAHTFCDVSVSISGSVLIVILRKTSEHFRILSLIVFERFMFKHCCRFQCMKNCRAEALIWDGLTPKQHIQQEIITKVKLKAVILTKKVFSHSIKLIVFIIIFFNLFVK